MNKRVTLLEEIATIAASLPDEELRKLERFADFLQEERSETRLRKAARELVNYLGINTSIRTRSGSEMNRLLDNLEEALRERKPDTLFKTADSLMRFYAEAGSNEFRSRFGSLDILEPCRRIISEGEGNSHPWKETE